MLVNSIFEMHGSGSIFITHLAITLFSGHLTFGSKGEKSSIEYLAIRSERKRLWLWQQLVFTIS